MKTSINTGGEFYLADFGYFSMSVYTSKQISIKTGVGMDTFLYASVYK